MNKEVVNPFFLLKVKVHAVLAKNVALKYDHVSL